MSCATLLRPARLAPAHARCPPRARSRAHRARRGRSVAGGGGGVWRAVRRWAAGTNGGAEAGGKSSVRRARGGKGAGSEGSEGGEEGSRGGAPARAGRGVGARGGPAWRSAASGGREGGGRAWGRERARLVECRPLEGRGGGGGRVPAGGRGEGSGRGDPAAPRPGRGRLQRPERGGPHRRGLGGAAFPRPVPECVSPPPPSPRVAVDPPLAAAFRLSVCLRPSLPSGCV